MLKSMRLTAAISLILLTLTTACSVSKPSQDTSSASKSTELTAAAGQTSSEVALANHLKQSGAKMYGTFWCPYCNKQKELFGKQAFSQINYIECDPNGQNPRLDLCQKANVNSFPTWEINNQLYPGMQSLQDLAQISGYQGDRKPTSAKN